MNPNKRKFVARKDETHGVVRRDITLQYEREMEKRYGRKWRAVVRGDLPDPNDTKPVGINLEDSK